MNGPSILLNIALGVLMVSALAGMYRLWRGPGIADRIVALDLLMMLVIGALCILIIQTGERALLDLAFVAGLTIFLGTIAVARVMVARSPES